MAALLVATVACFVTSSKRRRQKSTQQLKPKQHHPPLSQQAVVSGLQSSTNDFGFPAATKLSDGDGVLSSYGCGGGSKLEAGMSPLMSTPIEARYVSLQRQQSANSSSAAAASGSRKNSNQASPKTMPSPYRHQNAGLTSCPGSETLPRRATPQHRAAAVPGMIPEQAACNAAYGMGLHQQVAMTAAVPDRPLSMSELPPPPDFLLEGGPAATLPPPPDIVSGSSYGGGSIGHRRAKQGKPPLLFEIADGYRSGDSVDDDIDDIDPTIRTPSMFVQPY